MSASDARPDPRLEYSRRLEITLNELAAKEKLHIRAGNFKLLALAAGLVAAWLAWVDHAFSPWWLIMPAAVYAVLAVLHRRVLRTRARLRRVEAFYRRGLARIDDQWAGTGDTGERFRNSKSFYAEDIDIFGRGSLFDLLSIARTPMGENRLAAWLLAPASREIIAERHALVKELRDKLDLRERLSVAGEELRAALDPQVLIRWAESRSGRFHSAFRVLAAALALALIATAFFALATLHYLPLLIVLTLEASLMLRLWKPMKAATIGMDCGGKGLVLFAGIIEQVEQEKFTSARLQRFALELRSHGQPASRAIRRLAALADWIDGRDSMFVKIIEIPLLYTVQVGLATEQWRRRSGGQVAGWLDIVAEMEALLSLAAYSYEHPEDPFPELAETPGGKPFFEAEGLGHPLIPSARCVRNSARLGGETPVLMVSGSNMSGKSTLLRAVGINTVLAMAGAPVRARKLRLTPVELGARIRTNDSLQEGRSRFYAEILRIRQVLDLMSPAAGKLPLLFLFDELLEGTNSQDRRIGAEGLVKNLISRGAIGIVTTHDLALTEITSSLGNRIHNVHFEEHIEGGKMSFDYVLREGVVKTSNALELMRWIGLDV